MIKRALKFAIGPSVGITLGAVIIPRMKSSNRYTENDPSIWAQVVLYFVLVYIVSFITSLCIEGIKVRFNKKDSD